MPVTIRDTILLGALTCSVFVATLVGLSLLVAWVDAIVPELPEEATPLVLLVQFGIPAGVAWIAKRAIKRRWNVAEDERSVTASSLGRRLLVAAYLVTWAFGVPAAQSHQDAWAVAEYKRLKATGSARVWDAHPRIRSYAAVPIAPGVLFTYHEYQLDGLYGFGGFELFLWYGAGVRSLGSLPVWVS